MRDCLLTWELLESQGPILIYFVYFTECIGTEYLASLVSLDYMYA